MEEAAGNRVIESVHGRRDLDIAEGILIGLRRCDPNAAYRELLDAADRQRVGLMALSSALVELASNQAPSQYSSKGRLIRPPTANGAICWSVQICRTDRGMSALHRKSKACRTPEVVTGR
jgi:hypothetical protein